jgi:hypothetical protein
VIELDEIDPVLFGAEQEVTIFVGGTFNPLSGVYAYDETDGNLTAAIQVSGTYDVNTPGIYYITYLVSDEAGNEEESTRRLNVVLPTPEGVDPILVGVNPVSLFVGDSAWNPRAGVYAFDNVDGDLSDFIEVDLGTFDPFTAGTYELSYVVEDAAGNSAAATRAVAVIQPNSFAIPNGDFSVNIPKVVDANGNGDTRTTNALAASVYNYNQNSTNFTWGWHGDGYFQMEVKDNIAQIDVQNVGTTEFGVHFYQLNRSVTAGMTYVISFRAKADAPRSVRLALEQGAGGTRHIDALFDLTTEWQTFTTIYQAQHTYTNGKLALFLGVTEQGVPNTSFYFDYVTVATQQDTQGPVVRGAVDVKVVKDATFDPWEGLVIRDNVEGNIPLLINDPVNAGQQIQNPFIAVSHNVDTAVVGNYTATYTLKDSRGNMTTHIRSVEVVDAVLYNSIQLFNTDFATARVASADTRPSGAGSALTNDWTWHGNVLTGYTIGIIDGEAVIDITDPAGHAVWTPHLYMLNRVYEGNTVYEITWKARAENARTMALRIEAGVGTLRKEQIVNLTTEMQTFTARFVMTDLGRTDMKLAFTFGSGSLVTGKIYMDDVNVRVVAAPKDVPAAATLALINTLPTESVVQNSAYAHAKVIAGIRVYNHLDPNLRPANVVVTGDGISGTPGAYTFSTATPGDYTLTFTATDRFGNVKVVTRTVTVTPVP